MGLQINSGISAFFKIASRKAGEEEFTDLTDWSENLIVDAYFNRLSTSPDFTYNYVALSDATSAPNVSETTMPFTSSRKQENFSAGISVQRAEIDPVTGENLVVYYVGTDTSNPDSFNHIGVTLGTFGSLSGTWSSIGLCDNTYNIADRALIRDSAGNPTTITIANNEQIKVYIKYHHYLKQFARRQAVALIDGNGDTSQVLDCIIKPNFTNSATFTSNPFALLAPSNGILSTPTNSVAGYVETSLVSGQGYSSVSRIANGRRVTFSLDAATGNGVHRFIRFVNFIGDFTIDFSGSPFVKTNTQTIAMTVDMTMARYSAPVGNIVNAVKQVEAALSSCKVNRVIRS